MDLQRYAGPGSLPLSALFTLTLLAGCSNGNGDGLSTGDFAPLPENTSVQPGAAAPAAGDGASSQPATPPDPTSSTPSQPVIGNQIQSTNVVLLTGAALDTLTKLITAAEITTDMVLDGAQLIIDPNIRSGTSIPIPECHDNTNHFGPANHYTFAVFAPGNFLPPGKNLNGNFSLCAIENALISGFLDLSGIIITGTPDVPNSDWSVSGLLSFGSLEFVNDDGTSTSFSNNLNYSAVRQGGVMTLTLEVESMNVEHNLNDKVHINYLLEPFVITIVENTNTSQYSVSFTPHPTLGPSLINRYTTNFVPDEQGVLTWLPIGDDIELLATADTAPLMWRNEKPNLFAAAPDGGELLLEEAAGDNSILVTLDSAGITLNLDTGATVTGQTTDWTTLLDQQ